MPNNMRPIHPGEHLREELEELGLSARAFANALNVPTNRITAILNAQRAVTADTALRLARYFGTSAEFWLNLQSAYELRRTRQAVGKQIERDIIPHAA
jgi:addiction module HigA family antidote